MNVYAIFLNEPNGSVWAAINEHWPERHFTLDNKLAFVSPPEEITTTKNISDKAGINGESNVMGVVLQISAYTGFNSIDLWEWLQKIDK